MKTTRVPWPGESVSGTLSAAAAAAVLAERGVWARAGAESVEVRAPARWAMVHHTWGLSGIVRAATGQQAGGPLIADAVPAAPVQGPQLDVPAGAVAASVPLDAGRYARFVSRADSVAAEVRAACGAEVTAEVVEARTLLRVTLETPSVAESAGHEVPGRLVAALGVALGEHPDVNRLPGPLVWGRGPGKPSLVVEDLWGMWAASWGTEPDRVLLARVVGAWGGRLSDGGRLELPWWRDDVVPGGYLDDLVRCLGAEASGAQSLPPFVRRSPPRRTPAGRIIRALAALGLQEVRTSCLREGPAAGAAQLRAPGLVLRTDLVEGILPSKTGGAAAGSKRGEEQPWGAFEIGVVFADDDRGLPVERLHVGVVVRLGGRAGRSVPAALAMVRRAVDTVAAVLGTDLEVESVCRGAEEAALSDAAGVVAGRLRLHPPSGGRKSGGHGAVSAELDLSGVRASAPREHGRRPAGWSYGRTSVDRTFIVGIDVDAGRMLAAARSVDGIQDARVVENFTGEPYGAGLHSLTLRFYLDSGSRSSDRQEVRSAVARLADELGALPREDWLSASAGGPTSLPMD